MNIKDFTSPDSPCSTKHWQGMMKVREQTLGQKDKV